MRQIVYIVELLLRKDRIKAVANDGRDEICTGDDRMVLIRNEADNPAHFFQFRLVFANDISNCSRDAKDPTGFQPLFSKKALMRWMHSSLCPVAIMPSISLSRTVEISAS